MEPSDQTTAGADDMEQQIKELADLCGVTESDMTGFVLMLRHFMDNGCSFEQAIDKSHKLHVWAIENATSFSRALIISMYDDLRAAA